jgi:hypothetical protein
MKSIVVLYLVVSSFSVGSIKVTLGVVFFVFSMLILFNPVLRFDPNIILPLVGVTVFGGFYSYNNFLPDIVRDLGYLTAPMMLFYIGTWVAKSTQRATEIVGHMILIGTIRSIIHLVFVITQVDFLSHSVYEIRKLYIGSGEFSVISLILIILNWRDGCAIRKSFPIFGMLAAGSNLLSITLMFSRTTYLMVFLLGFVFLRNRQLMANVILVPLALALIGFSGFISVFDESISSDMLDRLFNSINEIKPMDDGSDYDVTLNWRGYETAAAIRSFKSASPIQMLVGQGLGALVDLNREVVLVSGLDPFRYIPTFHNGYMYVLIKSGVVSVLLYIYWGANFVFGKLRNFNGVESEYSKSIVVMSKMLMVYLFCATAVIGGPIEGNCYDALMALALLYACKFDVKRVKIAPTDRSLKNQELVSKS